jgi:hypothetical protein
VDRPDPFLQALGIMTQEGKVRASMRDKFWQINEFLKLVSQTEGLDKLDPPLQIVDCGCGRTMCKSHRCGRWRQTARSSPAPR